MHVVAPLTSGMPCLADTNLMKDHKIYFYGETYLRIITKSSLYMELTIFIYDLTVYKDIWELLICSLIRACSLSDK